MSQKAKTQAKMLNHGSKIFKLQTKLFKTKL